MVYLRPGRLLCRAGPRRPACYLHPRSHPDKSFAGGDIRFVKWDTNAINGKPWRDHMARLCNITYCDLSVDLPDLADWNVAFKRVDTSNNVTFINLRTLRRTIPRCNAQAQPDHLELGVILEDGTDVVIAIADPSQRHVANLNLRSRHDGPSFLLGSAAVSLLGLNRRPLRFVLGLLLLFLRFVLGLLLPFLLRCILVRFFRSPRSNQLRLTRLG